MIFFISLPSKVRSYIREKFSLYTLKKKSLYGYDIQFSDFLKSITIIYSIYIKKLIYKASNGVKQLFRTFVLAST